MLKHTILLRPFSEGDPLSFLGQVGQAAGDPTAPWRTWRERKVDMFKHILEALQPVYQHNSREENTKVKEKPT